MTSKRGKLRPPADQDLDSNSEETQVQGNTDIEDEECCEEETPTQGNTNADDGVCYCKEEEDLKKIENWENFWDTEEGRDPTFWEVSDEVWKTMIEEKKTKKVAPWKMKQLRWEEWRSTQSQEDLSDPDRVRRPDDVLQEDIQDYGREMVVIGCDVESLYPNLDVEECGLVVEEEIKRTKITWEDLDYLEGCRMIALNRSAAYCRSHPLQRVLPVRRRKTGCRPGVTGKGPLGKERGDQEQWRFPRVTLTGDEKKMIIAEVVKIAKVSDV